MADRDVGEHGELVSDFHLKDCARMEAQSCKLPAQPALPTSSTYVKLVTRQEWNMSCSWLPL